MPGDVARVERRFVLREVIGVPGFQGERVESVSIGWDREGELIAEIKSHMVGPGLSMSLFTHVVTRDLRSILEIALREPRLQAERFEGRRPSDIVVETGTESALAP